MSRDLGELHPQTWDKVNDLLDACRRDGLDLMVTSTYRSFADQAALYAQGRTETGKRVTNARPGSSFHNVRRAVDFAFVVGGKPSWADHHPWEELGGMAEGCGLTWGGRWRNMPDRPHVEDRWCQECKHNHDRATLFGEDGECRA